MSTPTHRTTNDADTTWTPAHHTLTSTTGQTKGVRTQPEVEAKPEGDGHRHRDGERDARDEVESGS
ncbi:hypothetical protein DVS28_b0610 (plasmid) [Euzebya pacifica]|uniref:Uncharacterized protein n=1 Tax=Euzebya pacifica TaxID=1608957 RepID=A0A346Y7A3_9ACTN|nr:hypothetical protein DVS28_b0610 [Euzebya pacifica]